MNYRIIAISFVFIVSSFSHLLPSNLNAQPLLNNVVPGKILTTSAMNDYAQNDSYLNQENNKNNTNFCVIVRYPVHANKLNQLQKQMNNPKTAASALKTYKQTIEENSEYFNLLNNTFKEYFNATPYFFLPDSSFKVFNTNPHGLFVNEKEQTDPSLSCPYEQYYLLINGNDEDQWLFVTKDLVRAPEPLPYKKKIFFPAFKKIFNRPGYLATQVKYFNEQLSKNASK